MAHELESVRGRFGVQVIALGEGKFRAVGYHGGLPGAGWNGEAKVSMEAQGSDGQVTFGEAFTVQPFNNLVVTQTFTGSLVKTRSGDEVGFFVRDRDAWIVLDPVITTAHITRNHGYMIYDVLTAVDENFEPQPQMADWEISDDGLVYTFTLREGLVFHDGAPVTGVGEPDAYVDEHLPEA